MPDAATQTPEATLSRWLNPANPDPDIRAELEARATPPPPQTAEEREALLASAKPIDQAGSQPEALMSALAATLRDHRDGLISDEEMRHVVEAMDAPARAFAERMNDDIDELQDRVDDARDALADAADDARERGEAAPDARAIADGLGVVHPVFDVMAVQVDIADDAAQFTGEAARAVVDARAALPGGDPELLEVQHANLDRVHASDAATIAESRDHYAQAHDYIDAMQGDLRDGTLTEHSTPAEIEAVAKAECQAITETHATHDTTADQ